MRMDGRTDMTKLTVAFRNFAKSARNYLLSPIDEPTNRLPYKTFFKAQFTALQL